MVRNKFTKGTVANASFIGIALAARPCDFEVNHQEYSSKSASRAMTMARTGELEFESLNGCDWLLVRAAFFRFFVAMLK